MISARNKAQLRRHPLIAHQLPSFLSSLLAPRTSSCFCLFLSSHCNCSLTCARMHARRQRTSLYIYLCAAAFPDHSKHVTFTFCYSHNGSRISNQTLQSFVHSRALKVQCFAQSECECLSLYIGLTGCCFSKGSSPTPTC